MMQKFLLVLASVLVVGLPAAQGLMANSDYPTFAKCNPTIMSAMQTFWKTSAPPKNNLKKIEESGKLIVLHTAYNHFNDDNKCIFIKVIGNTMDVIFTTKNGDMSANHTWIVEEGDDGVIRGRRRPNETPEITWNWYTIFFVDGVHVCYICSDNEGSQEPYHGNIMLTEGSNVSVLGNTAVSTFLNLLKAWGIEFKYSYGSECLSNGSSTLPLGGMLANKPPNVGLGSIF